jgi:hypothetical protein
MPIMRQAARRGTNPSRPVRAVAKSHTPPNTIGTRDHSRRASSALIPTPGRQHAVSNRCHNAAVCVE